MGKAEKPSGALDCGLVAPGDSQGNQGPPSAVHAHRREESTLSGSGAAGGTLTDWDEVLDFPFRAAPPVYRNTSLPALSFSKRLLKKNPEHKCPNPSILSLLSQQAAVPIPPVE